MNIITLFGRLVRDVETRYTQTGKVVSSFTLAVDRPYSKDGQKETDFIDCEIWEKQAELIGNSCSKGHRLLVSGALRIEQYEDKQGNKRSRAKVVCNNFNFIERKNGGFDSMGSQVEDTDTIPF